MKNFKLFILLSLISVLGCEKDNNNLERIIGKWQLVRGYDIRKGGFYSIEIEDQRIEEYTKINERIGFDYIGNEISRCGYTINETKINIFGKEINGQEWESSYEYWFKNDTLKIRNDGGFEFYDEFFIRIK
jgi:hypothetical protein